MLVVLAQAASERFRPRLEQALSQAAKAPVRVGSVRLSAWPLGLAATDIAVGDAPSAGEDSATALQATVRSLWLAPHWPSLLLLRPAIGTLWADGIAVYARFAPLAGQPPLSVDQPVQAFSGLDPRQWRLPVDIVFAHLDFERIALAGGNEANAWQADVRHATVLTEPTGWRWRRRRLSWRIGNADVALPASASQRLQSEALTHIASSGEAIVYGSFRRPRRAQVVCANLTQPQLYLRASAAASLADPNAPVEANVDVVANPGAQSIAALAALPDAWRAAHGVITARYRGTWAQGRSELEARVVGPTLAAGMPAAAQATWVLALAHERARWQLIEGQLRFDEVPVVRLQGDWDAARSPAVQGQLHAMQLPALTAWRTLHLPGASPVDTTLSGYAHISGDGDASQPSRLGAAAQFEFATSALRVLGPRGDTTMHLQPARYSGRAKRTHDGQLRLEGATLSVGDEVLHLEGAYTPASCRTRLAAGDELGFDGIAYSERFSLDALSPIAGLAYSGPLHFGGAIKWSPGRGPFAQARVEADALRIGPVALGASSAELTYDDAILRIAEFDHAHAGGRLRGQGAISFAPSGPTFLADVHLARYDLGDALRAAGASDSLSAAVRAPLWGDAHVYGTFLRPEGRIHLQSPRLQAMNLALGKMEFTALLGAGRDRLRAQLHAAPRRGSVHADVAFADGGTLSIVANSADLPLLGLVPGLHPEALMNARLALSGPARALGGALVAHVHVPEARLRSPPSVAAAAVLDRALGAAPAPPPPAPLPRRAQPALPSAETAASTAMHLVGRAEAGKANLELSAVGGALHGLGTLLMHGTWPLHAAIDAKSLPVAEIGHWFLGAKAATGELGLIVNGKLSVDVDLMQWRTMAATLQLASVTGRLAGTAVALTEPVSMHLHQGTLSLPAARIVSKALQSSLTGRLRLWPLLPGHEPAADAVALHADADGELSALGTWVPTLTAARGTMHAHVAVHGQLTRPSLLGEIEVQGGSLRLGEQPIDHLAAKLVFTGRAAALTYARADVSRGRISAQGEWTLAEGDWLSPKGTVGLRMRLERVPFRPLPDAQTVLTGNLELTGAHEALRLHGDLHVDSLRYTAKLDLDRLVPKRRAPPLKASFLPFARPVALAIKLRAQNDAIVSSKVVEAELTGDLLLTGTSDRVGLLGSISPLWARARYRDNVFTINHATVDFTDEYRIAPVYSIEGLTRACQMNASVTIAGDSEGYNLVASGRDDHGLVDSQDVLSCLHMGVRLSDFTGTYGHSAGFSDALSGSFDALWTVSGLDDKVRKFLPIRVDELRLTSGWSSINQRTTPRVVVGRDLGRGVSLRYVRAIDELSDQAITLEYKLHPNRVLQGGYMSARDVPTGDFGLDLRLQWELP